MLAHSLVGQGSHHVIVLHDWFSDRSNWDAMHPYLEGDAYTYAFLDLRGYGESRSISGNYTLEEAAQDVIALARHLAWKTYSLVGHSMTSLVVQRIPQLVPDQINRIVAVAPVGPTGLNLPPEALAANKTLALANAQDQAAGLTQWYGDRLGKRWVDYKVERWRATANAEAVAKYAEMWGGIADCSAQAGQMQRPLLAICGAHDAPYFHEDFLQTSLLSYYKMARAETIADSGHFPMLETPPLLAAKIHAFLAAKF